MSPKRNNTIKSIKCFDRLNCVIGLVHQQEICYFCNKYSLFAALLARAFSPSTTTICNSWLSPFFPSGALFPVLRLYPTSVTNHAASLAFLCILAIISKAVVALISDILFHLSAPSYFSEIILVLTCSKVIFFSFRIEEK